MGLRAMKHKAVRVAGASCPCTDLHHFLARVNVAGGTSGACELHGRLLLAICTCLLSFGYPRVQCCLTAALPTVWATFANLCSIWLVVGWQRLTSTSQEAIFQPWYQPRVEAHQVRLLVAPQCLDRLVNDRNPPPSMPAVQTA